MTHAESSREGRSVIFLLFAVIFGFIIINYLITLFRSRQTASNFDSKDKCLLPTARVGCKRKYPDGSFDCVDCDWLKSNIASNFINNTEFDACVKRCRKDCPTCNCEEECRGILGGLARERSRMAKWS
jgi:hypothetical protein